MKFRTSAAAVLIGAVILVIAIISLVSNLISHRMAASFEQGQFVLMGKIMQSKLHGAEGKAISAAESIAAMPAIKKAFAARNRDELLASTKGSFLVLKEKYGISQGQFHLPPAVSFLRIHNPEKFGDDQSRSRQIVVEVNRVNSIRKGIEITSSGIAIFGTLPMTDEAGKNIGSFETGMDFGPLLDELKKTYGFELALFIDEKSLRETATSIKADIYSEQNRVGPYVKFYATHPELMRNLVTDKDIVVSEDTHYLREANGVPHGVILQPVYNYAKRPIGVLAMAANFSETRSADGQAVVWQSLLGILSAILLSGVVLVVIRGMLLRPMAVLNERVNALANGEEARELPGLTTWCQEMQDLAGHCERLARHADHSEGDKGESA